MISWSNKIIRNAIHALRLPFHTQVNMLSIFVLSIGFASGCAPPIIEAAGSGNLSIVKAELSKGENINVSDNGTPLIYAIRYGRYEVARYLIDNGADVNARDNLGRSALYHLLCGYQISSNQESSVPRVDRPTLDSLISHNADLSINTGPSDPSISTCIRLNGNIEIIQLVSNATPKRTRRVSPDNSDSEQYSKSYDPRNYNLITWQKEEKSMEQLRVFRPSILERFEISYNSMCPNPKVWRLGMWELMYEDLPSKATLTRKLEYKIRSNYLMHLGQVLRGEISESPYGSYLDPGLGRFYISIYYFLAGKIDTSISCLKSAGEAGLDIDELQSVTKEIQDIYQLSISSK